MEEGKKRMKMEELAVRLLPYGSLVGAPH